MTHYEPATQNVTLPDGRIFPLRVSVGERSCGWYAILLYMAQGATLNLDRAGSERIALMVPPLHRGVPNESEILRLINVLMVVLYTLEFDVTLSFSPAQEDLQMELEMIAAEL